jgi:hypothetical protein
MNPKEPAETVRLGLHAALGGSCHVASGDAAIRQAWADAMVKNVQRALSSNGPVSTLVPPLELRVRSRTWVRRQRDATARVLRLEASARAVLARRVAGGPNDSDTDDVRPDGYWSSPQSQ